MLHRIRTAAALPRTEFQLTLRAIGALAAARVLIALVGFRRLRGFVGVAPPRARPDAAYARMVRRAVDRAARTIPGSKCLAQALVATRLRRAGGVPGDLTIGVVKAGTATFEAHAWARSGDMIVTGDPDLSRYTELATFFAPT
ncbi:MAG TPA: lasso peptide biosynthesis B2 protein [Gemmatimonadaceae bacterium]|nr:lasso peptide biosynthesis B2 protein [Gemmatimonadaceae bacterium]